MKNLSKLVEGGSVQCTAPPVDRVYMDRLKEGSLYVLHDGDKTSLLRVLSISGWPRKKVRVVQGDETRIRLETYRLLELGVVAKRNGQWSERYLTSFEELPFVV